MAPSYARGGGRGRGRGGGRGGRGGNSRSSNYKTGTSEAETKSMFYLGSHRKASDYSKTKEAITMYVIAKCKQPEDFIKAFEDLEEKDWEDGKPVLKQETAPDGENITAIQVAVYQSNQAQNRDEYNAKIKDWQSRERAYQNCNNVAYTQIWDRCESQLQHKIKAQPDYETKVKQNAILLMKAVEKYALNFYEKINIISPCTDSMVNALLTKQRDEETLDDYYTRFKANWKLMNTHLGNPLLITTVIEKKNQQLQLNTMTMPEFAEVVDETDKSIQAYMFLQNCNVHKYGSYIQNLQSRYAQGEDKYPTSLLDAKQMLDAHKWDAGWQEAAKKKKESKTFPTRQNTNEERKVESNKTDDVPQEVSFNQMENRCWICGKPGHFQNNCPKKDKIPKEQWAMNKAMNRQVQMTMTHSSPPSLPTISEASVVQEAADASSAMDNSSTTSTMNWMQQFIQVAHSTGVTFSQTQADMRDLILLDNQSTVDTFCNPNYVTNIRPAKTPMILVSNTGEKRVTQEADVANYGTVWYDPTGVTNIFSLKAMKQRFRVTFDSDQDSHFLVHTPNKVIKFRQGAEGLYYINPNLSLHSQFVETVKENKSYYTDRQVSAAKRARSLMHALSCPSASELKKIITMNAIQDCPVTLDDIALAEQIFGKDVASLKGKTTRQKPDQVIDEIVEIPRELMLAQHDVELFVDTYFVNGLPFLATISKNIKFRTASHLTSRTISGYTGILIKILALYSKAGFTVKRISADREFKPVVDTLDNVEGNYASALEHVPVAERNNRTQQERVRATFYSLPFRAISKNMTIWLVEECARKLNYFPVKGGVSEYFSPRMIVLRRKLDYRKHCAVPQFAFVQAHDEPSPSNTQAQRTLDCLYICPTDNVQEGHRLLNLITRAVITRRKVTPLPMPDYVISTVEAWAKEDGFKALTMSTKTGHVIYDSSWTAGVDYTHETLQEVDDPYGDEDYSYQSDQDDDYNRDDYESESDTDSSIQQAVQRVNAPHQGQNQNEEQQQQPSPTEINDQQEDQDTSESEEEDDPRENPSEVPPIMGATRSRQTRRSGRARRDTERMQSYKEQLTERSARREAAFMQAAEDKVVPPYDAAEARVLAMLIDQISQRLNASHHEQHTITGVQHLVTYSLNKGIKKFGQRGRAAAEKEMRQLHDRDCFRPIDVNSLNQQEKQRALESLLFLVEKRDGTIKARTCANGSVQREWMSREDVSSPTVSTESTLLTAVIEASEGRDVATCDIPNAFIQTEVEEKDKDGNRTIMKIRGVLAELLCEIDPVYNDYLIVDRKGKILYVQITKAIYGMLVSAMLFYKKLVKDLQAYGFELNPYDPCVANKMVDGTQMTVSWHVDDLKVSHKNEKNVTEFLKWVTDTYGQYGEVKTTRGKLHDYLGMTLNYKVPGQVTIDMRSYVDQMRESFPETPLQGAPPKSPWTEDLFKVDEGSMLLDQEQKEQFHTTTAQGLFLTKRARPDIGPAIAFFTTRVRAPTKQDWEKLVRMMKFLISTRNDCLTLQADGSKNLYWHVDASFAVHGDFKSHTGGNFTMGKGTIAHVSRKQSLNTRSSTEAELVAADDLAGPMLWTRRFLECQGYQIKDNKLFQDNRSAILLESNGRKSAGKRSRHLNIRYFFITDQKEKKNLSIHYCPTDDMIGDYFTKPTHGSKFTGFRDQIMNLSAAVQLFTVCFIMVEKHGEHKGQ